LKQQPIKVLVADDEPTARLLMSAALQKAGFEVSVAADGEEALREFRAHPFDVVMLDVEMPGLNGYQVCTALRQEVGDDLPIVMVTAMEDTDSIEQAFECGATDFIAKPINWSLIGHRVKYLMRGYQAALDLRKANDRNTAVLNAIPDLMFEIDIDGRYIDYHSPRIDLLAAPAAIFIGKTVYEVMPPEAAEVCMFALREAHEKGSSTGQQFELKLQHGLSWFELSVSPKISDPEQKPHFIVLSRDITDRKQAEQKISQLAYFDSLTRLPNRQSFIERLNREIRVAQRGNKQLAVLFMDLDGFKAINDTMGHNTGDLILQWAADRLQKGIRPYDIVSRATDDKAEVELARLGGDEFTALIPNIDRPEEALLVAHRIRELMRRPFVLDGREVVLTASIGIALFPGDGEDSASLLKHADTAMYHAKDNGRDNCQFYSASLTQRAQQRLNLENNLRQALAREEFSLVYQPQLDLVSGRIQSIEALIRWNHPEQGAISPMDFIPLAEENGLIVPIGEWVLRTACTDAARWQAAGFGLRVAVNLSPMQFKDPNLVKTVFDILAQTGLAPELLELEVTEGAVMEDSGATLATLENLSLRGVKIALDDFGTGYSSMSYLKRMPLNNLKVDQSFVQGLPHDRDNHAIVRAILSLAKNLGFSVTAEGVETLEQAETLKEMACDTLQGYYFSRPVPAAEIPTLFTREWLRDDPQTSCAVPIPAVVPG
jgi:diguanylate cyclase (GGDEF)-like protein/PAS domain S-box-containing protein